MYLSLSLLLTVLARDMPGVMFARTPPDTPVGGVRLYCQEISEADINMHHLNDLDLKRSDFQNIVLEPDCLYLSDSPLPLDEAWPEDMPLLWICPVLPETDDPRMLPVIAPCSLLPLHNRLQRLYTHLSSWVETLRRAAEDGIDLHTYLNLAPPIFNQPMLLYDPSMRLLAFSQNVPEGFTDSIFEQTVTAGHLHLEAFHFLEKSHIIETTSREGFLDISPDEYQEHAVTAQVISLHGHQVALCVLIHADATQADCSRKLFSLFCQGLQILFRHSKVLSQKDRSAIDYFLMDLLSHPDMDDKVRSDRQTLAGLNFEGEYVVILLRTSMSETARPYMIDHLRRNLLRSQVFSYEGDILILYQLNSQDSKPREHIEIILSPLLQSEHAVDTYACISRRFSDLARFPAAYAQALRLAGMSPLPYPGGQTDPMLSWITHPIPHHKVLRIESEYDYTNNFLNIHPSHHNYTSSYADVDMGLSADIYTPELAKTPDSHALHGPEPGHAAPHAQPHSENKIEDKQNTQSCHFLYYADHILQDLFHQAQALDPIFCYCHESLLDMLSHQTERDAIERKILYAYLYYDRKVTEVATVLNMHRNNVVYHISQLRERYHLDLDNPALRLELRIGLEMLKERGLWETDGV